MRLFVICLGLALGADPALAQPRPRPQPMEEIAPPDGTAGIAAIVDRRSRNGCVIALGLQHRTGRTREMAIGAVEVFTTEQMSEIITVTWRFTDEGQPRWSEIMTRRPCQQSPTIVVRSLRLCGPAERSEFCEPRLVPFRPGSRSPLPWLVVTYRTGAATPGGLDGLQPARPR